VRRETRRHTLGQAAAFKLGLDLLCAVGFGQRVLSHIPLHKQQRQQRATLCEDRAPPSLQIHD
jgi:hypothetical protein